MCGIAGTTKRNIIGNMHALIAHRGPDDQIRLNGDPWDVAYSVLQITSARHGKPRIIQENGAWLLFSGELFGYPEERYKDDVHFLFDLLQDWNPNKHLVLAGQFAFAYWRHDRQLLILGRDPFGERPLYYSIKGRHFSFASESKALLPTLKNPKVSYDRSGVVNFLETDVCGLDINTSMIQGVKQVPQNSVMVFRRKATSWLQTQKFSVMAPRGAPCKSTPDDVGDALYRAIQERSHHGDKEVGVYLSGGLDSALISMICRPKHVFTCVFDTDIGKREAKYASSIAKRIGATHHIVKPKMSLEAIQDAVYYMDGPQGTMSPVAAFALAKEASKHVKVVLTGQGADEMFCGYFRDLLFYADMQMRGKYPRYAPLINYYNKQDNDYRYFQDMAVARFLRLLNRSPDGKIPKRVWDVAIAEYERSSSFLSFVSEMELLFTLPTLVQMDDRAAAHVGIESRSPFLDEEVYYHADRLSDHHKISLSEKGYVTKKVLRDIARGLVPDCVVDEVEKTGLYAPMSTLFGAVGARGKFDRQAYALYCKGHWEDFVKGAGSAKGKY